MTFYSQCKEDQLLYERYFKGYTLEGPKYFFEMGALDGVLYNNTKFFEDSLGWSGLLVEGNPVTALKLAANRQKCCILNAVVSDAREPVTFKICTNVPAVCGVKETMPSNFDDTYYRAHNTVYHRAVPVPLSMVFANCGMPRIDLAVLDVEGHEMNVLNSWDHEKGIPVVSWLIECFDDPSGFHAFMKARGYRFMENIAHNLFYVREDYVKFFGKTSCTLGSSPACP